VLIFDVPVGLANFSLTLSSAMVNFRDLELRITGPRIDGGFQLISLAETNFTFTMGEIEKEVQCAGSGVGLITGDPFFNCIIPDTPVSFAVVNKGGYEAFVNLAFEYESDDCSLVPSTGCQRFDQFYAQEAIYFWSRNLRAAAPTKAEAHVLVAEYTEDVWAIPWYRWQAAWNKPLSFSWNNQWNDWRFAWSAAFRILDVNQDGYLTLNEYDAGYDMQAPVCGVGTKRISPIILGCSARSAAESRFSEKDPRLRSAVPIPAGTTNLNVTVKVPIRTPGGVDVSVEDLNKKLVVGSSLSATINKTFRSGKVNNATLEFSGDQDYTEFVNFTGSLSLEVVGVHPMPWKLSLNTYQGGETGYFYYSHGKTSDPNIACSPAGLPIPTSGCDSYDAGLAQLTAQVWGSMSFNHGANSPVAAYTVLEERQFLPWFNWYQYWSNSMGTAAPELTASRRSAASIGY
jgi:hypothetical protein